MNLTLKDAERVAISMKGSPSRDPFQARYTSTAPSQQQLRGELSVLRGGGNVQAAEPRAKTSRIDSGSRADGEEIFFITKQKVLGFVTSVEAITLQVFERLRENRDPEFLFSDGSFDFLPAHN
jgi:hypothetical protein